MVLSYYNYNYHYHYYYNYYNLSLVIGNHYSLLLAIIGQTYLTVFLYLRQFRIWAEWTIARVSPITIT